MEDLGVLDHSLHFIIINKSQFINKTSLYSTDGALWSSIVKDILYYHLLSWNVSIFDQLDGQFYSAPIEAEELDDITFTRAKLLAIISSPAVDVDVGALHHESSCFFW